MKEVGIIVVWSWIYIPVSWKDYKGNEPEINQACFYEQYLK